MKKQEIKENKKITVTEEGNREEVEVSIQFMLEELETVDDLRELLDNASMEVESRILSGINSIIKGAATYKVAKYQHLLNTGDESPEDIPSDVSALWALSPVQGGRFSYRKAAEQARQQALDLASDMATGKIDAASFAKQYQEAMAKAAEMDAKADEQAAQRKPRAKKGKK